MHRGECSADAASSGAPLHDISGADEKQGGFFTLASVDTGLAIALLGAAAVAGSASPAAADAAPNSTPATAVDFASVPYETNAPGCATATRASSSRPQPVSR